METLELDVDTAVPLGLITNELLTNSFKHAFNTSKAGKINIGLARGQNNELNLTISDNGIGAENADLKEHQGFGSL